MLALDRAPFRLLLALVWMMVWGLRTVVVRMFDAVGTGSGTVTSLALGDAAVACLGGVAVVVAFAVLFESALSRFSAVVTLLALAGLVAPAVSASDPVAAGLLATHLLAALLVWRTPLAPKSDRSNLEGGSGTRIGVN